MYVCVCKYIKYLRNSLSAYMGKQILALLTDKINWNTIYNVYKSERNEPLEHMIRNEYTYNYGKQLVRDFHGVFFYYAFNVLETKNEIKF